MRRFEPLLASQDHEMRRFEPLLASQDHGGRYTLGYICPCTMMGGIPWAIYASLYLFVGSPAPSRAVRHRTVGTSSAVYARVYTFDRGVTGGWEGFPGPPERVKTVRN